MFFQAKPFTEKATDISHAYLLLTIYLYLDCLLSYTKNTGLIDINFDFITTHMTVGGSISSIALFIFLMASIPTTISTILTLLAVIIEYDVIPKMHKCLLSSRLVTSNQDKHNPNKSNHIIRVSKFEKYVVKTDNSVGFSLLQDHKKKEENNLKLIKYCTTFILFLIININMMVYSYESVVSAKIWSWVWHLDLKNNTWHFIMFILLGGVVLFAVLKVIEGARSGFRASRYDFIHNYDIEELKK